MQTGRRKGRKAISRESDTERERELGNIIQRKMLERERASEISQEIDYGCRKRGGMEKHNVMNFE